MNLFYNIKIYWLKEIFTGIILTFPVLLVYLAMGVTFGVLAIDSGLTPLNVVLMSFLIYAGTAQLVGIQLISIGASPLSILITTFVINSRFFIMSSSITHYFSRFSIFQKIFYSVQMTDATFAIHTNRFSKLQPSKIEIFTTNSVGHFVWVLSTILGIYLGESSFNLKDFAIDFAMPAMFIGLLVPLIEDRTQYIVVIISSIGTISFFSLGFAFWTTLAATIVGIVFGIGIDQWNKK
ncbi:AzlC family ABC transporter permease [Alphaproteobacteria bacterium]|nr:AzlC family ABC transporter permease [Alphaproteobacteria bacterium]